MKRSCKGQGLPITTIIIAALGLIVLVILIGIMTGRLKIFGSQLRNVTEERCPTGIITNIYDCPTPIYGNFVELRDRPDKVCCNFSTEPLPSKT